MCTPVSAASLYSDPPGRSRLSVHGMGPVRVTLYRMGDSVWRHGHVYTGTLSLSPVILKPGIVNLPPNDPSFRPSNSRACFLHSGRTKDGRRKQRDKDGGRSEHGAHDGQGSCRDHMRAFA